ncbi:MAG TPA: prolipoprotein diacylglyceryl transferase family protein [Candidatus Binatia bacterium]|nr:prolipoprotein diacylglyceryl transferase family protein [Candidatus Binatia bacterium]
MHPTLAVFALPWLDRTVQVDAYPLAHLLAFITMVTLTVRRYARDVGPPAPVLDVFLVAVPAGLLGAHYVAGWTSGHPARNPLDTLAVYRALDAWSSAGKSAYGGLVAGIGVAALAARVRRLPVGALFDAAAPGLAVGAAIARLGCFLGGCCYGRPTPSFLGVRFPDGHLGMAKLAAADPRGLHPTQLYLAAASVSIAVVLATVDARRRRPGDLFRLGAGLYAATSLAIEFLRDDPGRWFAAGLSHSQWISLAVLGVLSATVARRALVATAATVVVVTLAAPLARADDTLPATTVVDVVGRALAGRDAGAAVVLGRLLEIGGGGPLGTWSRIGLGADRLLDGRLGDAVAEWRAASTDAGATPWGAQAELAVGLGEAMTGRQDAAIAAFRAAVDGGEGETLAFAAVSLGRVLAATGDPSGAEASFRRVLADHPRSGVADDAALGLARVLVDQGRLEDASDVLAQARRYERAGSYRQAGRDRALAWEKLAQLGERRLATLLRRRAARAVAHDRPVVDELLAALTDRYAGRELRRLRHDVARRFGGEADAQRQPPAAVGRDAAPVRATASRAAPDIVTNAARFYAGRALVALALASFVVAVFVRRGGTRSARRRAFAPASRCAARSTR